MSQSFQNQEKRIIFFDLMRALAAIMMIQGHTIDCLLAKEYRMGTAYFIWEFMRGFTAPIFIFASGAVFTYLLFKEDGLFWKSTRVKKGFQRFWVLLFTAYLLRYPTAYIFYFGEVADFQWKIFFTVDILHLIAFSLLFIIGLYYLKLRFSLDPYVLYSISSIIILILFPFAKDYEWSNIFPLYIANYFYKKSGSIFPLIPYLFFAFAGAVFGIYLRKNKLKIFSSKLSIKFLIIGIFLTIVSLGVFLVEKKFLGEKIQFNSYETHLIIFRLGVALVLSSIFHLISLKINSLPVIISSLGKYSFSVYIAHIILLYGSAWTVGIGYFWGYKLNPVESILAAVSMIALMVFMVQMIIRFKEYKLKLKLSAEKAAVYEKT
jgi:hypothetical protein